jgi:hypothetical protein
VCMLLRVLFVPCLQCRQLQCMQLIHFLLLSLLDDVSVLMVVCFVDFSVRGISVSDPAEGCSDDVSVFPCFVTSGDNVYVFLLVQC